MKFLSKLLKFIVITCGLLILLLYIFDYDYILKATRITYGTGHKTAFLEDYKEFDNRVIKSSSPQPWNIHKDYNKATITDSLERTNIANGTIAYLIIKNDSIWFEKYYDGFQKTSKTNSFSMAKSIISAMLGKAIMEGKVRSLNQKVSDFYPEFKNGLSANLTVGDLSSMASGLDWDESYYSPFSVTTRAYFDEDLAPVILNMKGIEAPGKSYKYLSGNTQLLGMVLEKATGQNMSGYLSEEFWKPMGFESDALWQLDSEQHGLEKAYCCIASNARDFARFGKLYKDYGKWNGEQLLDSAFVQKSITPRFPESPEYGYGWWLKTIKDKHFFMMRGHLGQYVIVEPEDNLIIVRLGHTKGPEKVVATFTKDIFTYIEEAYTMLNE
ncbi:beta-lactamase [Formosa agariphila KMM 3901]|uniref:Beta-lactamase n=1 Tax=Formosa agariphila (strain DSM 15362 / KCTC 12365 / LMG 23005 / KMM 3901 / M-2Alg 35-1) TaxID=1347342 RepID=T2KRK6_FORAG|nr:serine hydrolase [Formosa agariphila]CDF81148.1 beta-lactamase [Formosa agariphila KMM 3901]